MAGHARSTGWPVKRSSSSEYGAIKVTIERPIHLYVNNRLNDFKRVYLQIRTWT